MRSFKLTHRDFGAVRLMGVICALAAFGGSQANAAIMADLLAGGSITCGDKLFTNFRTFSSNASGGADAPSAAQIFVSPDTANCGTYNPGPGLLFQSAAWNVNPLGTIDTAFTFDVIVPKGEPRMDDATLSLLSFDAQNGGEIHISESLFSGVTNVQNLSIDSLIGPIVDHHVFPNGGLIHR